jgi:hypothetical protein
MNRNLAVVAINVPGSLLQKNPPLLRKDALIAEIDNRLPLEFLPNVCILTEVSTELLHLAKLHDTFVPPPLRKVILGRQPSDNLTDAEKAEGERAVHEFLSLPNNHQRLVAILVRQGFNCQDLNVDCSRYEWLDNFPDKLQALGWLLDCVRTKFTRTACTESHIRAYEYLAQKSQPYGLILEDDLRTLPEFYTQLEEIVKWLEDNNQEWDFIQLGYSKHDERPIIPIVGSPLALAPNGAYGNTAVLVNLKAGSASRIAAVLREHRQTALRLQQPILANDVVLAQSQLKRFVAAVRYVGPPLGNHESVLAGKTMNYDQYCWDAEQRQ